MTETIIIGLVLIVSSGIAAQWAAWRIGVPSILLLLATGLVLGPATGILDPLAIFPEDLLNAIVSLAVSVILFEGGLTLRMSDLKDVGKAVRNLITIGTLVTWVLAALAAKLTIGLPWPHAITIGAILVVTGPTVIIPMLQHLRPKGRVGPLAKWEGIVNDPVGAVLALLVLEVVSEPSVSAAIQGGAGDGIFAGLLSSMPTIGGIILRTLLFGIGIGGVGAWLMATALKKRWLPDYLHNPIALAMVLIVATAANHLQHESGLLSVTIMGIALANQKQVPVHSIAEFKEDLQVLLISCLFIMLSAALDVSAFAAVLPGALGFLAALILVVRPASVIASSVGTDLTWPERIFMIWMAPRGIVAAAVSSVFAIRLEQAGILDSQGLVPLVPVTFVVIAGTVTFYGLTAGFVAKRLGLTQSDPQGILMIGAQPWVRQMAKLLKEAGVDLRLVDNNPANVNRAREAGLDAQVVDMASEANLDDIDFGGIGKVLALTSNDALNALVSHNCGHFFDQDHLYRLAPNNESGEGELHGDEGRILFLPEANFECIDSRNRQGDVFKSTLLTDNLSFDELIATSGENMLPLFIVSQGGIVTPVTTDTSCDASAGDRVIYLNDTEGAEHDGSEPTPLSESA